MASITTHPMAVRLLLLVSVVGLACSAQPSGLYAMWDLPANFGTVDVASGKFNPIASLSPYIPSISTDTILTLDSHGNFWINLEDQSKGMQPTLISVSGSKVSAAPLNITCPLWEMAYDSVDDVLYGVLLGKTSATILRINKAGTTFVVGTFPLAVTGKLVETKGAGGAQCYVSMSGGVLLDSQSKLLYVHYSAGSLGMYVEMVNVHTAQVVNHLYIQHDLVSPVLAPDFKTLVSLEMQDSPPYAKWLSVVNILTGSVKQMPPLADWFTFMINEATLQFNNGKGVYYTPMGHNLTDSAINLVAIDITTGLVTASSPAPTLWNLYYAN